MRARPFFIGIAGPSGSGKTTLARRLEELLPGSCALISLDSYYHELAHLSLDQRGRCNFDHPDALDWNLLLSQLAALSAGQPIEQPLYNFETHTRAKETVPVSPAGFVIVEGILTLYRDDVRRALDLKVYVDAPDANCFDRRLERDMRERGRTRESVHYQYQKTVRPMAELYVWPTRVWADLILSGTGSLEEACGAVLALIPQNHRTVTG